MATQAQALKGTQRAPAARNGKSATPPRPLAETLTPGLRFVIMLAIMAATMMEVLDTSIVNVALPDMMGNLGATLDQIGWVSTGYIIANVIVLPLTGWLSDYFGRKRYLTYSVILFTVASFFCGTSRTLSELIIWRVMQGAGGAAFLSTAQATLMEIYPPNRRGFAQAMFGIGVIAAPTLGPTLGGWITDRFTWPWIFFVNLPVGVIAATLTVLFLPDSPAAGARRSADFVGIGFLALGLGSLQTLLERGEADNWFQSSFIVTMAILSVIGVLLFIWWELRPGNKNPAVNLHVVTNRNLAAGTIYAFALGLVLYGGVFVLPQFLQNVQSHTAEQSGLLLMPGGLASAAMMPVVGQLSNRVDKRFLIGTGMVLFVISMYMFAARLNLDMPDSAMFWPLAVRGAAIGLQFVPLSLLALGTLPTRNLADGAGFYNLFRQLGGSFGIAILATIVDRRMHFHYQRLAERLSPFDPATQQRLLAIQNSLVARGQSPTAAHQSAYQTLSNLVTGQAAVLTYVDVFKVMGWVGIGALLLLFLFQRARNRPGAAAAAH
ncbi:MAG TPA: DHA2 family efflux MFS transporter permease subunit [Chthonomonadaceae bacterium]|nr:DHA2 family efflux MFS transporter permease subunit [Chthonomonadaceae bacterium]